MELNEQRANGYSKLTSSCSSQGPHNNAQFFNVYYIPGMVSTSYGSPKISQESNTATSIIKPILQVGPLKLVKFGGFASNTGSGRMRVPTSPVKLEPVLVNWKWQKKKDTKEHASGF